ncbi:hypothetical protein KP509_38G021000 [Ceratopteris richardii]|uniref:Uncharacterized protein n=1 Tax=Ceratopteris richardii TaxID=49495 RepID=A0A8T2Q2Z6_CERRI|nr:hypothetical protein KP509_38G021000 [Ceratopteris richardii]
MQTRLGSTGLNSCSRTWITECSAVHHVKLVPPWCHLFSEAFESVAIRYHMLLFRIICLFYCHPSFHTYSIIIISTVSAQSPLLFCQSIVSLSIPVTFTFKHRQSFSLFARLFCVGNSIA